MWDCSHESQTLFLGGMSLVDYIGVQVEKCQNELSDYWMLHLWLNHSSQSKHDTVHPSEIFHNNMKDIYKPHVNQIA